jgi:hypothetical protein
MSCWPWILMCGMFNLVWIVVAFRVGQQSMMEELEED